MLQAFFVSLPLHILVLTSDKEEESPYGARLQLPDCLSGVQKTLGLVMIVKDEAATIQTTLASMRDHIDDWTIVDTGSTDGTQAGTPWPAP